MICLRQRLPLVIGLGFASLVFGLPSLGFAQTPGKTKQPPAKSNESDKKKKEFSDPTKPNPKILQKLQTQTIKGKNTVITIPKITLKARIISANAPAAALVEVDGEFKMLRNGDELFTGGGLTFRVIELNGAEIRIEIPSLNRTISLY